jgi:predicted enzyme related to lactoylglutathione lyase
VENVIGVLARVFVDDLDAALPVYRDLAGGRPAQRFAFKGVELARVGPFLLLSGDTAPFRDRVATILVRDVDAVADAITRAGGDLVDGPAPGPNGRRLIAAHPDGSVFEYIEEGGANGESDSGSAPATSS